MTDKEFKKLFGLKESRSYIKYVKSLYVKASSLIGGEIVKIGDDTYIVKKSGHSKVDHISNGMTG